MGLDMYLSKRTYVKRWDHRPPKDQYAVAVTRGDEPVTAIKPERVSDVVEEVAYWRKGNAIHAWFVDTLADGEDDCREIDVSRDDLQRLLDAVSTVLASCRLVKGKVKNGYRVTKTLKEIPILEDGEYIEDPSVARAVLPTRAGFFFGSTDYDQYYVEDLEYTKRVLTEILAEPKTDFESFVYRASW